MSQLAKKMEYRKVQRTSCEMLFVKKSPAELNTSLASRHKPQSMPFIVETTTLLTHPEDVSYLLSIHATQENIAYIRDKTKMFPEPQDKTLSQYVETPVADALQCGEIDGEHYRNGIFIGDLTSSSVKAQRVIRFRDIRIPCMT